MTLATTVAVPVLRGPAATAKILAAIDVLSGGRLVVGLGPGSSARDYELVGVRFEERWKRLDEAVQALRAYWRADDDAFEGAFYSTAGFTLAPPPTQRPGPPIWIGSWGSLTGLKRVATLADGWLASGYNTTPELFAKAWSDVQAEVAPRGRDADRFPHGIATMWCYVTEDRARADVVLADVLAPMLNRPVEQLRATLPIGMAEDCAEKLAAYARAGAQRVFLWAARRRVRSAGGVPRARRSTPRWVSYGSGRPRQVANSAGYDPPPGSHEPGDPWRHAMPTVIGHHDVKDTAHWLASPKREEFFGPLGVTNIRTFVDPQQPTRVAVLMDVSDMDAVITAMQTDAAAAAMDHDGVLADTLVLLVEA